MYCSYTHLTHPLKVFGLYLHSTSSPICAVFVPSKNKITINLLENTFYSNKYKDLEEDCAAEFAVLKHCRLIHIKASSGQSLGQCPSTVRNSDPHVINSDHCGGSLPTHSSDSVTFPPSLCSVTQVTNAGESVRTACLCLPRNAVPTTRQDRWGQSLEKEQERKTCKNFVHAYSIM